MNGHPRFVALLLLAVAGSDLFAQAPPPPPASPTLWSFLGIPQACYKVNAQLFNRRGNLPQLEKKPPLKGIADPANLKSDVPAIKAAAEIKQAEDLKPQKIKAVKYLALIGCGCYDKDEKITKALLAAMEDCTEEVRLEAVKAVGTAASGQACSHCKERSCCQEKIVAQLSKMAYERDDLGCYWEPSRRVREAAMDALRVCCQSGPGPVADPMPTPVEGGERPTPVEGGEPTAATPPVARRSPPSGSTAVSPATFSRRTGTTGEDEDEAPNPGGLEWRTAGKEEKASGSRLAPVLRKVTDRSRLD